MPINIQEILYPNDSDSIKWEKVNYNFDQIIATGGKEGPKGEKGGVGPTGVVGSTGEKGEKGDVGEKGQTGTSTDYWERYTSATQNITSYVIKPKNNQGDDQAAIIIGDSTYDEGVSNGEVDPSAQLTVYSDAYYYAQKWGPTSGTDNLSFRGETETIGGVAGTRWIIQPEGQGTNTNLYLNSEKISLVSNSEDIYIDSAGSTDINGNYILLNADQINMTSVLETFINGSDVEIDGSSAVNIHSPSIAIESSSTGTVELGPVNATASQSAIRVNSTSGSEAIQFRGKMSWGASAYQTTDSDAPIKFNGTGLSTHLIKLENNSNSSAKMIKMQGQSSVIDISANAIKIQSQSTDKILLKNDEAIFSVPVETADKLTTTGKFYQGGPGHYAVNTLDSIITLPAPTLDSSFISVLYYGSPFAVFGLNSNSYSYDLLIPDGDDHGQRLFLRVVNLPARVLSGGIVYTASGNVNIKAKTFSNTNSTISTISSSILNQTGTELTAELIWVETTLSSTYTSQSTTSVVSRGYWRVLSSTTETISAS